MSRNFAVKNTFPVAVAVHNVSLGPPQGGDEVGSQRNGGIDDSGGGFRIESFVPTVIGPGQTKDNLFILTLPLSSGMVVLLFNSQIYGECQTKIGLKEFLRHR